MKRRHVSPLVILAAIFRVEKAGRTGSSVALGLETTAPFKAERPGAVEAGYLLHSGSCRSWGKRPEFW